VAKKNPRGFIIRGRGPPRRRKLKAPLSMGCERRFCKQRPGDRGPLYKFAGFFVAFPKRFFNCFYHPGAISGRRHLPFCHRSQPTTHQSTDLRGAVRFASALKVNHVGIGSSQPARPPRANFPRQLGPARSWSARRPPVFPCVPLPAERGLMRIDRTDGQAAVPDLRCAPRAMGVLRDLL